MLFTLFMAGCEDKGVDPPPPGKEEKKWEVVPEFINLDIRYMIHFKNELYAAVVNYQGDSLYKGAVLKTSDGDSWKLVKTFNEGIGPMTVEGDSLYVNGDHFIHKMDATGNWVIKFGVPWQIAEADLNGDMIFLNGNLYVSQTRFTGYMYEVTPDSQWKPIYYPPGSENGIGGARFVKIKSNDVETCFFRQWAGYIFQFDGKLMNPCDQGLPPSIEGANSIVFHNDTLFAGFIGINNGSSGMMMYLDNNAIWKLYRDSLLNSPSAFRYIPPATTLPTSILFVGERIFVATEVFGVLEWNPYSGWQTLNKGLMPQQITNQDENLYNTISFLEYFHGKIFVGYGDPAFMWRTAIAGPRKGLLKYKLK
ncbi:MAG: hypothetical protein AB1728_11085 [Bacteroidota bacterium]